MKNSIILFVILLIAILLLFLPPPLLSDKIMFLTGDYVKLPYRDVKTGKGINN